MLLRCPASGMTVSSAPGTSAAIVRASAIVVSRSCSPTTKCVGTAIAARLPTVSWLTVASSDLEVRRLAERGHALEELLASGRRRGGREQGRHDSGRDVPWLRSRVERLATESDVLGALLGGERCESTMGVAQRERGHPLRVQEVEPHRDAAAHGQPDQVLAAGAVMVEDAPEIAGEIVERERPGGIVRR